jgi:hypothetical protein
MEAMEEENFRWSQHFQARQETASKMLREMVVIDEK